LSGHALRDRYHRFLASRLTFDDTEGDKPWWASWTYAQPHVVEHVDINSPAWQLPALRVVVLADLHIGSHAGDLARFESIVEEVNALQADLIVMPGDFVNMMPLGGGRVPPEVIADLLSKLTAKLGVFAVLGNHDNELSAEWIESALSRKGIRVLSNAIDRVDFGDGELTMLGLTDARSAAPDYGLLVRTGFEKGGLVLAHDPASFAHMPEGAALMICGHTHGGQLCLPGRKPVINMSTAPLRWTAGHINEGGRHLYVSRGLGTSSFPFRTFAPPELSVLTISGVTR